MTKTEAQLLHETLRSSVEARYKAGKTLRRATPREALGEFSPGNRDPLAILDETNKGRLPQLLPIRRARMAQSPFAFLRGAAAIMAADLADCATPGIATQACGDCHLMNFGAFLSPEGNALFDINDFDETLPGVDFTVDLRRLAASCAVAAIAAGESGKAARRIAKSVAASYRKHICALSALAPLEAWNARVHLQREAAGLFEGALGRKLRHAAAEGPTDRSDADFPHICFDPKTTAWRIEDRPPLIYHVPAHEDASIHVDIPSVFAGVMETLAPEVAALLMRYRLVDDVFKVVGVGSVGTYCAVGLFATPDGDTLFLQIKEARPSELQRLKVKPWEGRQGARVVRGQRIMQAASDLFLGHVHDEASGRDFYVRHLKNRRLGSISELLETTALADYAALCGLTLARAHARTADAATLSGYMGKSEAFDDAIASFAMLYAAQNKKDFETFVVRDGEGSKPGDQS